MNAVSGPIAVKEGGVGPGCRNLLWSKLFAIVVPQARAHLRKLICSEMPPDLLRLVVDLAARLPFSATALVVLVPLVPLVAELVHPIRSRDVWGEIEQELC